MSILAVDDNDLNLRLVVAMLERLGFKPLTAKDGLEAVEIYQDSLPECILMDIQMPLMNGIDATEKIREIEKASTLPPSYISALTANTVPDDHSRCTSSSLPDACQSLKDVATESASFRNSTALMPLRKGLVSAQDDVAATLSACRWCSTY